MCEVATFEGNQQKMKLQHVELSVLGKCLQNSCVGLQEDKVWSCWLLSSWCYAGCAQKFSQS